MGNRWDLEILHVNCSLLASIASGSSTLAGLLVRGEVEGDEEEEV